MMKGKAMNRGGSLSSDEKVMIALGRAAELFKRRSSCIFSYFGLSFSQYNTLRVLDSANGGSLSITEISKLLLVSTPNMSGIAKRLAKSGFAERLSDEKDDRKTILRITPKGRQVVHEISPLHEGSVAEILKGCNTADRDSMLDMLKKMLSVGNYDIKTHLSMQGWKQNEGL